MSATIARMLTPEELIEAWPAGRNSVYRGLRDGTIPSIRLGRRYLIPVAALERLLASAGRLHDSNQA